MAVSKRSDARTVGLVSPVARVIWSCLFGLGVGYLGAQAHIALGLILGGVGALFVWERTAIKNLDARADMNTARWGRD